MNKKFFATILSILLLTAGTVVANAKQVKEPDFGPYMRNMQRSIKCKWHPPKEEVSKQVVLNFNLDRKGNVTSYEVLKSSGDTQMDNAAIEALKSAAPFGNLPASYKGDFVTVQFTFDYNVFQ